MRGYIAKKDGKVVAWVTATQGGIQNQLDSAEWSRPRQRALKDLGQLPDGVYRAATRFDARFCAVDVGAQVDPGRESQRLFALNEKADRAASTKSPGIAGYQQRAMAARSRQANIARENVELAGWLRETATKEQTR